MSGVTGVSNATTIRNGPRASDVRKRIEEAFRRQANLDAATVTVTTRGGKVTLGGKVHAWHERQAAEKAAWAAPGVTEVNDRILVA